MEESKSIEQQIKEAEAKFDEFSPAAGQSYRNTIAKLDRAELGEERYSMEVKLVAGMLGLRLAPREVLELAILRIASDALMANLRPLGQVLSTDKLTLLAMKMVVEELGAATTEIKRRLNDE